MKQTLSHLLTGSFHLFLLQWHNIFTGIVYLAIRRSLSAGARWSLPLHLRGRLRNPDPDKVDDMVQIGEEVGAREPAVVAMLLNAGLLETKKGPYQTLYIYTVMQQTAVAKKHRSNLILLVFLNLVVQAQLDQVEHHTENMLRHVLMIHPYLKKEQFKNVKTFTWLSVFCQIMPKSIISY